MISSPINPAKQYYEFNLLLANSIDFGIKDGDMSMISMRSVTSQARIQMTLNLKKRELDIQFPLCIGRQTSNFRFMLPISLLSHIYKVPGPKTGQMTLIIPYETSPRFFVQKGERQDLGHGRYHSSFSAKDKIWSDWDTWYRETDIIDSVARTRLTNLPLMNHKDAAIVDIGKLISAQYVIQN